MATFESLPTELQVQIWQLTLNEPRIIELGATPRRLLYRGRAIEDIDIMKLIKLTTNNTTLMHPALSTHRLSRILALNHYDTIERALFDPANDILYFGPEFSFTRGCQSWNSLAETTDIRHFAFHLPTFRLRNDFVCLREVCELRPEGITFVLEAPFTADGPFASAMPNRFMAIDHQLISSRKELRDIGKAFKEAQVAVVERAYENFHASFGTFGRRLIEGWDRVFDENGEEVDHGLWKMPRVKFLVEDQRQVDAAWERRRRLEELEREREAAEKERARVIALANAPPVSWSTPEMSEFEEYLYHLERC